MVWLWKRDRHCVTVLFRKPENIQVVRKGRLRALMGSANIGRLLANDVTRRTHHASVDLQRFCILSSTTPT